MNKQYLKNLRDKMPEALRYILAPLVRNKLVNNKEFRKYYKLLENREVLSSEKIKEYQLSQLKQILIHGYQNVPYYQELFDKISFDPYNFSSFEEMTKIPFLEKEIIRENFEKLTSRKKIKGGFYLATTGGSNGEPLRVLLDYDSIFKENAFIYYYRKKNGYRFEDRLATFRGIEFGDKLWSYSPMYNELTLSPFKLSKHTLESYVNKINNFNPQYLNGYLSSIHYFAKLLSEQPNKKLLKLKGIFLISENIDNEKREFVEEYFNLKTVTFYGHSERCIIAEEKIFNGYVFDTYYGYTEQVKIEDNQFSIVGTGFLNLKMPLIRYITDDICIPNNGVFSIGGRWKCTDGLYGKNDEYFGLAAFNFHSSIFMNIARYQLIQNEKGKADLLIIINKNFKASEIELMQKELNKKTKGIIEFNIKIVDSLILSPRGKFKLFISNILNE